MASSASGSFAQWIHTAGDVSFSGTWSASVSRNLQGNDVTLSVTVNIHADSGDESRYYLYIDNAQKASHTSTPHWQGNTYTLSCSYTYTTQANNGTGTIKPKIQVYTRTPGDIWDQGSSIKNPDLTYPSKTTYTISYDANGGSGAPASQTKYYGTDISLSATKPTKSGYDFLGWSASSSATSATWVAGGTYSANESKKLYAVWKASTSTIISATDVVLSTDNSVNSTIKWKPNDSTFRFKIKAQVSSSVGTAYSTTTSSYIIPNSTNQYTYSLAFDATWIQKITKTNSATCTLTLYTYNSSSSTALGSATKPITLTVPNGLNSTILLGTPTVYGTAAFNDKIVATLDKINIPWTYTQLSQFGSPLGNLTILVNGERLTATSGASGSIITENILASQNYGTNNIVIQSAIDQRGNSVIIDNNSILQFNAYRYFPPEISVKFLPGGKLDITGVIAYVGGANTKQILLSAYEGNSSTPIINEVDITSSGTWTPIGNDQTIYKYDHYYPINFGDGYDVTSLIPTIDTGSYRFVVKVLDSKNSTNPATASTNSAVPVMTFKAGGTGIEFHKPIITPSGSNNSIELWGNGDTQNLGGRIKVRASDGYLNSYIDNYDGQLRIMNASEQLFGWYMEEPYRMQMATSRTLTSTDNLDTYKGFFMDAWCDNVQNKPSASGQYGRLIAFPFAQMYWEYGSNNVNPVRVWFRAYTNSVWGVWQRVPTTGELADYVIAQGTSGNWYYRKWKSLRYEAWYRVSTSTSSSGWTSWGSLYYKNVGGVNYPVTFSNVPVAFVEVDSANGNFSSINVGNNGTASKTGDLFLYRPTSPSSSINSNIHIYVSGTVSS